MYKNETLMYVLLEYISTHATVIGVHYIELTSEYVVVSLTAFCACSVVFFVFKTIIVIATNKETCQEACSIID